MAHVKLKRCQYFVFHGLVIHSRYFLVKLYNELLFVDMIEHLLGRKVFDDNLNPIAVALNQTEGFGLVCCELFAFKCKEAAILFAHC